MILLIGHNSIRMLPNEFVTADSQNRTFMAQPVFSIAIFLTQKLFQMGANMIAKYGVMQTVMSHGNIIRPASVVWGWWAYHMLARASLSQLCFLLYHSGVHDYNVPLMFFFFFFNTFFLHAFPEK